VSTIWGDLLWCDGGWPGSCHNHELLTLSGLERVLDTAGVTSLLDRGFRGLTRLGEHWHAPVGDRRTKDRLSDGQRAFNRCQTKLRLLVEQAIGHLATPGRCGAAARLLYRSGVSPRPPAPSSARAGGPTGSRHKAASRTLSIVTVRLAGSAATASLCA
jgi:hypothetical protein